MITIRQATIADKPAIFEFLKKAYKDNAQYKYPERWEWQFINNPYKPNPSLPVWIAVDEDGTVVGQSCAMYEPLKIGSNTHTLSWALDAYVLPEFRGQNLGFETLRANLEDNDLWMGLIMAESSRHILTKLGCQPVDNVTLFKRIARFDADSVIKAIKNRFLNKRKSDFLLWLTHTLYLDTLIAAITNFGVWIKDLRLHDPADSNIEIKRISEFTDSFDEFWERVSPQYNVIIRRDSKFLNWKYVQQPDVDYQKYISIKDGNICGYIILRHAKPPESNSGIIADLLVSSDDKKTLNALLTFAVQNFKKRKVKYISAAGTSNFYKGAFESLGFKTQKYIVPLFHGKDNSQINNLVLENGSWFLGRSDHDWDQYPYG